MSKDNKLLETLDKINDCIVHYYDDYHHGVYREVELVKQALIKGSESEKENARLKEAISALVEELEKESIITGLEKDFIREKIFDLLIKRLYALKQIMEVE